MEMRRLGKSEVIAPVMGAGTLSWIPGRSLTEEEAMKTYAACVDNGLVFFDTAEIYGSGRSERLLGKCLAADRRPVMIASKFAPPSSIIPLRQKRKTVQPDSPRALLEALDGSLLRLGVDRLDLYQIHAPPSKNSIGEYMDVMAEAVMAGKVRAVGVCNFSESQMREAHAALARRDIPLATAMVGYNLLRRWPETNGVLDACRELDVTLIPYSPLAQGILTGKYRSGERKVPLWYVAILYFGHLNFTRERTDGIPLLRRFLGKPAELDPKATEPLFEVMDEIASAHGKTLAQVAINWLLTTPELSVLPIPGMKSVRQVGDNLGALGWPLTAEERDRINQVSRTER